MSNIKSIKNFCIISHVDHGKSTLADRFLEVTRSINERDMEEQFLDQMELERERGITVKMAPVRMGYRPEMINNKSQITNKSQVQNPKNSNSLEPGTCDLELADSKFILNLIDTPGHSDFSYEVSRALAAVEGAILLVDGSQGVQAQTVANYRIAKDMGLKIIGAVNKIDLFRDDYNKKLDDERLEETVEELDALLEEDSKIHRISALKGDGVEKLLDDVCRRFPPPDEGSKNFSRALIFDSFYDRHKGVVAGVRVYDGAFESDEELYLMAADEVFRPKEVGFFKPEMSKREVLETGEIGYIATGLKEPKDVRIGDTVTADKNKGSSQNVKPLPGYKEPDAHVFVSFYPESGDDYDELGQALEKLRLNDSALTIEGDRNEILGRGYKVGFLGKLHYEITNQRLEEEFGIRTVNTLPSVRYKIKTKDGDYKEISRPEKLPDNFEEIHEPKIDIDIFLPPDCLNDLLAVKERFRIKDIEVETLSDMLKVSAQMPLPELISGFSGKLKSLTRGFGSFSYDFAGFEQADVVKVDILVSKEPVPGLSRFLHENKYRKEARRMVEELKEHLPRKQYSQPVQARAKGDIIVREDVPALRKDVTEGLYGGDYSRKKKKLKRQREGKKKLQKMGQAEIDPEVFKKLLKK